MRRLVPTLAIAWLAALPAGGAGRAIQLADYYRLESVTSPAISPDGRWVAFVRTRVLEAENRRHGEVWLAATDGSQAARRLTSPAFGAGQPRFSPDGKLLAFSSRRRPAGGETADEADVWFLRMEAPGGEAFQIPGVAGTPHFSPDNRWIAFTRKAPVERGRPAAEDGFERRIRERFKGHVIEWLGYRFDGRGYLPDPADPKASPPRELYVVAREGGAPRQLTTLGVDVRDVAWSPDSSALAVTADAHQRDEWIYERADLWRVGLDGRTTRLSDDGYDHEAPAFTQDGRTLVFLRQEGLTALIERRQAHGAPVDLYAMPAEGGPMRNLTADFDLIPAEPTPDGGGQSVRFSAGIGGDVHAFRVPQAGGRVTQITTGARRLGGFQISADGARMAYTAADATHPAELFVARSDGAEERRLSDVNGALLSELELSQAEPLRFTSRDGTAVEGWLLRPRAVAARDGAPPLILAIHGGPHGAYQNDWSFQFQLWAAHGYAVVYTNPRGSTGYGEKFLWATWGGWGDLDSEDVLAGLEAAQQRLGQGGAPLGVYGYSYGGFLTNWLITRTPRFAAAISGAGISNWVSDYATSDIPRTKESEFFGPPWEERSKALLIRQSPVHHAGAVRTPTLFLHGESDYRVPIEQAEQMYLALRKRRVPARLVRYPDTGHGGWSPWNMVHRHDQELSWWERHLGSR